MISTPDEYLDSLNEVARAWVQEFFDYLEENHKNFTISMFRQRPMYKNVEDNYLKGYLMFTGNKTHFVIHTLEFDIIEEMKALTPRAQFGKGCVKVKYKDVFLKPELKKMCDKVLKRYKQL